MAIRTFICPTTNQTRYEAYVNIRSRMDSTIRIQKYKKCKTHQEAKKEEKKLLRTAFAKIANEEAKGNCWNKVISLWEYEANKNMINPVTGREISEKTIYDNVNMLKSWCDDWLNVPAQNLAKPHGRALIRKIIDSGLKKCSIRKIKNTINTVYDFGIQEGIIKNATHSPVYGVSIDLPTEEKLPEILTVDEVKKLLTEAKLRKHQWYPVWALALMTGMRSGELYALTKENILWKENLIRITSSWDWRNKQAKSTKAKYWRNAPIADGLKLIIDKLLQDNPDSDFLLPRFPDWEKGEQARILRAFCEKIGIKSIRFHTLRACFATHLLASGTDEATVMRIGGWRDFKTFQIYIRLAGVKEKGATDGLGAVFMPSDQVEVNHISKILIPL